MKFHLDHHPKAPGFSITHLESLFFSGSCFSEHIAEKMSAANFIIKTNPTGIIFNPELIAAELESILNLQAIDTSFFVNRSHQIFSFQAHSSINAKNENDLSEKIFQNRKETLEFISKTNYVILSFGSAWYYWHKELTAAVVNCHKQNQSFFLKKLSDPKTISDLFSAVVLKIQTINPKIKFIFTLSPVKHLRDGVEENFLSKSILRYAINLICENHQNCSYFPAYELITEDLRDYRFFQSDLAHPTDAAIDYVWDKFQKTYFTPTAIELTNLYEQKVRALKHRPLHDNAEEFEKFTKHIDFLDKKINSLG